MRQDLLNFIVLAVILACMKVTSGDAEELPESLTFLPPSPIIFTLVDTLDSPPPEVKVRAIGFPPGGTFSLSMENSGDTGGVFTLVNNPPGTFTFRGAIGFPAGGPASVDVTYITPERISHTQTYEIYIDLLSVDPSIIIAPPSPSAVNVGERPLCVKIQPVFFPRNFTMSLLNSDPGTTGGYFYILDPFSIEGDGSIFSFERFSETGTATAEFQLDNSSGVIDSFTFIVEVNQKDPFNELTSGRISIPFGGPDFPDTLTNIITVSDHPPIKNLRALVDISHTFIGDVRLTLTSPQGITWNLVESSGFAGEDMGVIFDDAQGERMGLILGGSIGGLMFPGFQTPGNPLPFPYILPQESPGLSIFNGTDPNGDWILTITDIFPDSDMGVLNEWSLDIN